MSGKRKQRIVARKAAQRRRRVTASIFGSLLVLGIAFLAVQSRRPATAGSEDPESLEIAPRVGSRAPDFMLNDPKGNAVSFSDFRGKQVALNFMHTW